MSVKAEAEVEKTIDEASQAAKGRPKVLEGAIKSFAPVITIPSLPT